MIRLRLADLDDAPFLLALRNDPLTRANSRRTEEVAADTHARWLAETLANRSRRLYVALAGPEPGRAIGSGRLDYAGPDVAEVSLTVAPDARGHGFAARIVTALVAASSAVVLTAEVGTLNTPSLFAFLRAGFEPMGITLEDNGRRWCRLERAK